MNDNGSRPSFSGEIPVRVLSGDRPGLLWSDPLADLLNEEPDSNRYTLDHSGGYNPASSSRVVKSRRLNLMNKKHTPLTAGVLPSAFIAMIFFLVTTFLDTSASFVIVSVLTFTVWFLMVLFVVTFKDYMQSGVD